MYSNDVDSIETVLGFIDRFTANGTRKEVIDTFSCGCCYWFANILHSRFISGEVWKKCYIVYDQIENHFGCLIDDTVYDITGIVTDKYNWEPWHKIIKEDFELSKRIIRDCIIMTEVE